MIPRLVNSFLCSFKGLEKWLFWITGELNREEWFHYEIMIHDVQSFLRRVLATRNITHAQLYVLILVELWFHVLWFWTSGTKGFLQEQKTRVTRFSEEKKSKDGSRKQTTLAFSPRPWLGFPVFLCVLIICLPCIFVSLYLVVRAKISFSLSRHIVILQVVTHRCAYYRAWPTCLRKKIKVLQVCGILCVWLVSRV